MAQGGASLLIYIVTCFVILLSCFFLYPQGLRKRQNITTTPPILRDLLSSLVLLHTLFILYNIIVLPPPNVFTRLGLPLGTPTDSIRSLLLMNSEEPTLPKHIEQLLTRIGSFEMRTLYVRFGHDVVASCEFCSTFNDFALYAFAGPFLSYLREIALAGLITLQGTHHERYRTLGVGILFATIIAEGYFTSTAHIQIPQNDISLGKSFWTPNGVFMLHDNLHLLRQIIFLMLAPVIHFILPPSPSFIIPGSAISGNIDSNSNTPLVPQTPHAAALMTLQALVPKLQLLRYTRGAIMRMPALRDPATEWWNAEKQEGEWVREDDGVKNTARQLGVGFDGGSGSTGRAPAGLGGDNNNVDDERSSEDGPLRVNAKAAARNLMNAFSMWRPGSGPIPGGPTSGTNNINAKP